MLCATYHILTSQYIPRLSLLVLIVGSTLITAYSVWVAPASTVMAIVTLPILAMPDFRHSTSEHVKLIGGPRIETTELVNLDFDVLNLESELIQGRLVYLFGALPVQVSRTMRCLSSLWCLTGLVEEVHVINAQWFFEMAPEQTRTNRLRPESLLTYFRFVLGISQWANTLWPRSFLTKCSQSSKQTAGLGVCLRKDLPAFEQYPTPKRLIILDQIDDLFHEAGNRDVETARKRFYSFLDEIAQRFESAGDVQGSLPRMMIIVVGTRDDPDWWSSNFTRRTSHLDGEILSRQEAAEFEQLDHAFSYIDRDM